MLKVYREWFCIKQDRNEPWMKYQFSSKLLIPTSFPLVEALLKLLFWYAIKLHHTISFNVLHILRFFTLEINFQFRKQEKAAQSKGWWVCSVLHLYNPVFHKIVEIGDQKVSRIRCEFSRLQSKRVDIIL